MQVLRPASGRERATRVEPCIGRRGVITMLGCHCRKAGHNASNPRGVTASKTGRNSSVQNSESASVLRKKCRIVTSGFIRLPGFYSMHNGTRNSALEVLPLFISLIAVFISGRLCFFVDIQVLSCC